MCASGTCGSSRDAESSTCRNLTSSLFLPPPVNGRLGCGEPIVKLAFMSSVVFILRLIIMLRVILGIYPED